MFVVLSSVSARVYVVYLKTVEQRYHADPQTMSTDSRLLSSIINVHSEP